jgi:cytochrome c oxidase subunit 3
LLIASLGVFFFSSMLLYVVYVAMRISGEATAIPLVLPRSFIVSTLILIGISTAMHFAVNAAKRDETSWLIQMSGAALVMAVLFFVVQGDGMYWLIEGIGKTENATNNAYGLTFVLRLCTLSMLSEDSSVLCGCLSMECDTNTITSDGGRSNTARFIGIS